MLGKIAGKKRRGRQRMRWMDGITDGWMMMASSTDKSVSKLREMLKDRGIWHAAIHGVERVGHD